MPEKYRAVYTHRGERRFGDPKPKPAAQADVDQLSQRYAYVELCLA